MNPHLKAVACGGVPAPLAERTRGHYATISPAGEITVIGDDTVAGWKLSAQAVFSPPPRLCTTPWAVVALTPGRDMVVLNLSVVDHRALPASVVRALLRQTSRFCTTPPAVWSTTTSTSATLPPNGNLIIGSREIAISEPLESDTDTSGDVDTFSDLSPQHRHIALLLTHHHGLTFDQLFSALSATREEQRDTRKAKSALRTSLSLLRKKPGIRLGRNDDGQYTVARIRVDHSAGPQDCPP